jgi:hypothetical protein
MNPWLIPFVLQGGAMFVDEFHFHHKRGLPKWERIGHPLDTLTVLACFLYIMLTPFTENALKVYLTLVIFSCLFITKDELIHSEQCCPHEQWLHALLFILHPIILGSAAWLWINGQGETLFLIQFSIIFIFLCYQIIYWNFRHE